MIAPTPGRVLLYWPPRNTAVAAVDGQALTAIVAHAWSDTCVNIAYFDSNGISHNATSVLLVQPGADRPLHNFVEWPAHALQAQTGPARDLPANAPKEAT